MNTHQTHCGAPLFIRGALVASMVALAFLAVGKLRSGNESLACALGLGSVFLAGGAAMLQWPILFEIAGRRIFGKATVFLLATWCVWAALGAVTVAAFASSGWDDADYYLSGLAIRGYPTLYVASKPPVTHFIAAAFGGAPQFANAALFLVLVGLMSHWSIRRWGWQWAALPLALLAVQNVFFERVFGLNSEVPAAILLIAAFMALAKERWWFSGFLFALSGLTRWNLAVIPLAMVFCIWGRFGWRCVLRFSLGGLVVMGVFFTLSYAFVPEPIEQIVFGNFAPAFAWSEAGTPAPDFLSRSRFYFGHAFFLTPPAIVALVWALRTSRRGALARADDWCFRRAIPVAVAVYALAMLFVGGHLARFMAPIIPLALLALTEFLRALPRAWAVVLASVTAAWGAWPADVLPLIREKLAHRPVFSAAICELVAREVPREAALYAPSLQPIATSAGFPAMAELRRTILFPKTDRDYRGEILATLAPASAVKAALSAGPSGAYFIVPSEQHFLLIGGRVLGGDERWTVWHSLPSVPAP